MRHRLLENKISPLVAFLAIGIVGAFFALLMVRTIDTAEFLASQTAETL